MYKSPKLERYGTFRELTKGGGANVNADLATVRTDDFCVSLAGASYTCLSNPV